MGNASNTASPSTGVQSARVTAGMHEPSTCSLSVRFDVLLSQAWRLDQRLLFQHRLNFWLKLS